MPPEGIPGPPSLQSSNPLSRLDPTGLQGEVDQLTWKFHLYSVRPWGESAFSQVQSHWVEGESNQLPGTSERSSAGQGLPQKGERKTNNNFGVNVCVCEWPDLSWLQAQVCGSTAEKLRSPQNLSGSVLQFCSDPHMA
jgi:hypothetical protein